MESFYEPVVLEKALTTILRKHGVGFNATNSAHSDSHLSPEQGFQTFLNKIAQVCDSRPRGSTVTAFAVFRGPGGRAVYLFGSNCRTRTELIDTRRFIKSLLEFVGVNPKGLRHSALVRQALRDILSFNTQRVGTYLKAITKYLDICILDCAERRGSEAR